MPSHRQAQRICSKDNGNSVYLPGLNDWAFENLSLQEPTPLQISMDGSSIVRVIELYRHKYLVGESLSPDVRSWPSTEDALPSVAPEKELGIAQYVSKVRNTGKLAAEAYSVTAVDITGMNSDVLLGSIPEATKGVTASHIFP